MVFKLSWLKYMLVLAGIIFICDEQIVPGILFIAAGVAWIAFHFINKNKSGASNGASANTDGNAEASRYCPSCGAKLDADAKFCEICGSPTE